MDKNRIHLLRRRRETDKRYRRYVRCLTVILLSVVMLCAGCTGKDAEGSSAGGSGEQTAAADSRQNEAGSSTETAPKTETAATASRSWSNMSPVSSMDLLYADQFVLHQFNNILFDLPIVGLYLLLHCIVTVLVQKTADFGYGLVGRRLFLYGFIVNNYLRMENFLFYCLSEVVCYGTDKHTLRECTDFGCRYQTVQLRVDGSGRIVAVDAHGLSFLQDFPKSFRQGFGRFTHYLTAKNIAHS